MAGDKTQTPSLRWGILGTGWISTMFVTDLLANREDARANHIIAAVGSSSTEKGDAFVTKLWRDSVKQPKPTVYDTYQSVYDDPNVDVVYVGTPHTLHKQNCLDAIAAGKHVLCEKPFTINAGEAKEVIDAARKKGVFIMEAVWTRFSPIFAALKSEIIDMKSIGEIQSFFMDFANLMSLDDLPSNSRLKDPALGAGALLDIGIYTLTYASLIMGDFKVGKEHPPVRSRSLLSVVDGMDESGVFILEYPATSSQPNVGHTKTAILSSTFHGRPSGDKFARIEGTNGTIEIFGPAGSLPDGFHITVRARPPHGEADNRETRTFTVERPEGTLGFFWEADAVALDIAAGRKENAVMPLEETLRMMRLMDEIRAENGLTYPQDG